MAKNKGHAAAASKYVRPLDKHVEDLYHPGKGNPFGTFTATTPPGKPSTPSSSSASAPTDHPAAKTPAKTIEPFATPDDSMTEATKWTDLQDALYGLDADLGKLQTDTNYQAGWDDSSGHHPGTIDREAEKAQAATVDNMIARGLGQSSIKDGELYDIAATATIRKNFLTSALSTATLETGRRKKILSDGWNAFSDAFNRKEVENADALGASQPVDTSGTKPPAQGAGGITRGPRPVAAPVGITHGPRTPVPGNPSPPRLMPPASVMGIYHPSKTIKPRKP